jgi:Flp pilus assembly protein TadB
MSLALGCAWGALLALPFARQARRVTVGARMHRAHRRSRRHRIALLGARVPGLQSVGRVVGAPVRSRRFRRAADRYAGDLAVAVDLIGVGVGAGCTPFGAVELGAQWAPPTVAGGLAEVVRGCALGQSFDDALRDLGLRTPAARPLTDTLRTSARLGAPAALSLQRLAADLRADLRRRAEARARTVPVRLCFPLVACILPAFALLTVVPVVLDGLHH